MRELTKEQIEQVAGAGAVSSPYGAPHDGHKHKKVKHHHTHDHKTHDPYGHAPDPYAPTASTYPVW